MTGRTIEAIPDVLTVREAADFFTVSPKTIRVWINAGLLDTLDVPTSTVLVTKRSVARLADGTA